MACCDKLEASLATGEDTHRGLLDALLYETLEPVKGHHRYPTVETVPRTRGDEPEYEDDDDLVQARQQVEAQSKKRLLTPTS